MSLDDSNERISFIHPAELPGTELLTVTQSPRKWHVFHERYVLCTVNDAAAGWRYRGHTHFSSSGTLMLLEPGEVHFNTAILKLSDFKVLFMSPAIIEDAARELGMSGTPHFRLAQDSNRAIFRAYERLYESIDAEATPLEQQSRFAACVRLLIENYTEKTPPRTLNASNARRAIERAKMYLQERFNEPVSLEELSSFVGLSRFHLLRTFAKCVGFPPHTYQNHIRIDRAMALLRVGETPAAVATSVGFSDQSHLTRHFKKVWGVTPGAYIQNVA